MATTMLPDRARAVTGGVDTHKDSHVAAVVDHLGADVAEASFPNSAAGHAQLAQWLTSHGRVELVGVEGCGSWGAGLARHLRSVGIAVVEINRPNRAERRSRGGKTDTIDAYAAARSAAAGRHGGEPKSGTGTVETIRFLHDARRLAVATRTRTINQLKSTIDTAPSRSPTPSAPPRPRN
jgi:transposase